MSGNAPEYRPRTDVPFLAVFVGLSASYVLLILCLILADIAFTSWEDLISALESPEIRYAIILSLVSCTLSALLAVVVAVPTGYLMSRTTFRGHRLVDAILDIPIVLPPLVVGLSLLILFQTAPGRALESAVEWLAAATGLNRILGAMGVPPIRGIAYEIPAVILAQFSVATAFAVRTMRVTFDQLDPRLEQVAETLGCNRGQAFFRVVFPAARAGVVSAGTLAWARSMGEFGPLLVFAGTTRLKTEVLPTTVFLELGIGDVEAAVAVSLLMVTAAVAVLIVARTLGLRQGLFP